MKLFCTFTAFLAVFFLSGCSLDKHADIKDFVNEVRSRPAGKINPLPDFTEYESFSYSASGIRSPFQLRLNAKVEVASSESDVVPDFERVKEPLESFALSELKMVGTMTKPNGELWALIENFQNSVFAIKRGQHLGKNFGKITDISTSKVSILEIVPDGPGRWIERPQTMILKGLAND